jgi:hypothetical protein
MTEHETTAGEPARPSEQIARELASWAGVESAPHRFGGIEFRVGRRELGHLHGDAIADLPLPRALRDELIAAGRARIHRWRPDSGWVTVDIDTYEGVAETIALMRRGYERAVRSGPRRVRASRR